MYIGTLVSCVRWLSFEDKGWTLRNRIEWPILIVTLLVYTCLTAYLSIYLKMTLDVMFGRSLNPTLFSLLVRASGGPFLDMVQADLLLQQAIIADIARIIADGVVVNFCLSTARMTLC